MENVAKKYLLLRQRSKLIENTHILSLKTVLIDEIISAIEKSLLLKTGFDALHNRQQKEVFISEKMLLCPYEKTRNVLQYSCAIAFFLASKLNSTALNVAREIAKNLCRKPNMRKNQDFLLLLVRVEGSGMIYFDITNYSIPILQSDRNLIVLLRRLNLQMAEKNRSKIVINSNNKINTKSLSSLHYVYNRCLSLLKLGERIDLIQWQKSNSTSFWRPKDSVFFQWGEGCKKLYLQQPEAKKMLWQICSLGDLIAGESAFDSAPWLKLQRELSQTWLEFTAKCNFCGEVAQKTPEIATARLGAIALLHWYLSAIYLD